MCTTNVILDKSNVTINGDITFIKYDIGCAHSAFLF